MVSCCVDAQLDAKSHSCLNIREVIEGDNNTKVSSDYEYGQSLYPRYEDAGLSENFLIKKIPDVSLCQVDIKSIEVEEQPFSQPHLRVYFVSIYLNTLAANKVSGYTRSNMGKHIALEIDGRIFAVPKILEEVKTKIKLTAGWNGLEEIKRELGKISDNIIIHEKP
jgi:preprotein translocase subunit SecD